MNQIYLKSLDINNIVIPLFIEDPKPGRQGDRPKCTHLRGLQHLTQIEQILPPFGEKKLKQKTTHIS